MRRPGLVVRRMVYLMRICIELHRTRWLFLNDFLTTHPCFPSMFICKSKIIEEIAIWSDVLCKSSSIRRSWRCVVLTFRPSAQVIDYRRFRRMTWRTVAAAARSNPLVRDLVDTVRRHLNRQSTHGWVFPVQIRLLLAQKLWK